MAGTSSSLRRAGATLLGVALAAAAIGGVAAAKPDDEPKPKPKLELRTESQEEALRNKAIKVAVRSKRGDEVRVKATLVVDAFPSPHTFKLGPESKRLRDGKAKVRLNLSARKREVLAFAAQACDKATVEVEARAARETGSLEGTLRPEDC
ncbi:MAG: hypothetical protein ACRDLO_11505 [Solirubrobacterales bacterium]